MTRETRRSGWTLAVLGVLGVAFFWVTDPRFGPGMRRHPQDPAHADPRQWLYVVRGTPDNLVDAANEARFGTYVGIAGSTASLCVGLWLATRRRV